MVQPKFPIKTIPLNIPENAITERTIKCAIEVHRQFGPGLLEMFMKKRWILSVSLMD